MQLCDAPIGYATSPSVLSVPPTVVFNNKTFVSAIDTSATRHFGTIKLVPKCLVRVQSVLWPKCPLSGRPIAASTPVKSHAASVLLCTESIFGLYHHQMLPDITLQRSPRPPIAGLRGRGGKWERAMGGRGKGREEGGGEGKGRTPDV